jgi:hypothetical protein
VIALTLLAVAFFLMWTNLHTVNWYYGLVKRITYWLAWVFVVLAILAVALDAWRVYS